MDIIENRCGCPCDINGNAAPLFINGDYFCEIGVRNDENNFIASNPLWDGQGCANFSACCKLNNPLWFCKQLNQPTIEDIEICIMSSAVDNNFLENEDVPNTTS